MCVCVFLENGTVSILGSNQIATQGNQVTFQCLAVGWLPAAQLSWAVNGTPVNNVPYNTSSQANGTLMNSNSTLTIIATGNVSVNCLASISTLPSPEISTVFLTVRKTCYNIIGRIREANKGTYLFTLKYFFL